MQLELLPYRNPLTERLGKDFFTTLPRSPAVYTMRGEADAILYVGKAKDLRARLLSYRRARPEQVSRKVIRMIRLVRRIDWEPCESEEAALLRENQLLRLHRPPFNVVNVHPESYYLIGFRRAGRSFRFRLTTQQEGPEPGERLFGAFKGRPSVRDGYSALLRLLWACHHPMESDLLAFPPPLARRRPPDRYEIEFPEALGRRELVAWTARIRRFLEGGGGGSGARGLLVPLTENLLNNETIPPFLFRGVQEDLEALERFHELGPLRNRRLKRFHRLPVREPIAQERLDDLFVTYRMRHG